MAAHGCTPTPHLRATNWPEYRVFISARQRCVDPRCPAFKNYGGRGIEFRFASYAECFAELGPRPSDAHTLDRINNDGHYEKGNVRWATRRDQSLNQRPRTPRQFCKKGHALTPDNLGVGKGTHHTSRVCRTCHRENARIARKRNPAKEAARQAVQYALRRGILVKQPCQICANPRSEAHHHNYNEPLNVGWFCKKHHQAIHQNTVLPWPELSLDRKAFEQAQRELGDSANLREVLARAQQIKSQLSQKEN